jgi:hypothetical protein
MAAAAGGHHNRHHASRCRPLLTYATPAAEVSRQPFEHICKRQLIPSMPASTAADVSTAKKKTKTTNKETNKKKAKMPTDETLLHKNNGYYYLLCIT